jgi:hypothetical protein
LPIRLILAEDIPSDAAEGDPVRFKVAHDVRVEDTVVIPKGAEAVGVIVDGAKKKIFGIGGKMTFRLEESRCREWSEGGHPRDAVPQSQRGIQTPAEARHRRRRVPGLHRRLKHGHSQKK